MTPALLRRLETLPLYAVVALGSALGGGARAGLGDLLAGLTTGPVLATLLANATGSLLIGYFATLSEPGGRLFAGPRLRHFVMTGICGGYTSFSVFSLESVTALQSLGAGPAAGLVGLSLFSWLCAVWLGHGLAARRNRLKGG
ncbi:MAG: CrcB family protein [Rhodothalassiaceae bacterium]